MWHPKQRVWQWSLTQHSSRGNEEEGGIADLNWLGRFTLCSSKLVWTNSTKISHVTRQGFSYSLCLLRKGGRTKVFFYRVLKRVPDPSLPSPIIKSVKSPYIVRITDFSISHALHRSVQHHRFINSEVIILSVHWGLNLSTIITQDSRSIASSSPLLKFHVAGNRWENKLTDKDHGCFNKELHLNKTKELSRSSHELSWTGVVKGNYSLPGWNSTQRGSGNKNSFMALKT